MPKKDDPYYIETTRHGFDYEGEAIAADKFKKKPTSVGKSAFFISFFGGMAIFVLTIIAGSHAPIPPGEEEIPSDADWSQVFYWLYTAGYVFGIMAFLTILIGIIAISTRRGRGFGVTSLILTVLSIPGGVLGYYIGFIIAQIMAARSLVG